MLRRSVSFRGVAAPAKARTGATVAGHSFWGSTSKSEPRTRPSEALPRAPALSGEYRLRLSHSAPGSAASSSDQSAIRKPRIAVESASQQLIALAVKTPPQARSAAPFALGAQ